MSATIFLDEHFQGRLSVFGAPACNKHTDKLSRAHKKLLVDLFGYHFLPR